jgi:hypothetical protein
VDGIRNTLDSPDTAFVFHEKAEDQADEILGQLPQAGQDKGVNKSTWIRDAASNLKYGNVGNDFVKMALLITFTDTIPDPKTKGLLKKGKPDTCNFLKIKNWKADDLKTIEHVAPQTNPGTWYLHVSSTSASITKKRTATKRTYM